MRFNSNLKVIAGLLLLAFTACKKTDQPMDNSIEGTYVGTLTTEGLKSTVGAIPGSISATTDVTKTGDREIEIHCYSDELDTTFMLDYFDDNDSIMVCLTGDAFEEMYGHMMGDDHIGGGMMGGNNDGETEWQQHLNEEHQPGDEHFGGFDMTNHTFGYRFQVMNGDNPYLLDFLGLKSH